MQLDRPKTNHSTEMCDEALSDTCNLQQSLVQFKGEQKWKPCHECSQVKDKPVKCASEKVLDEEQAVQ